MLLVQELLEEPKISLSIFAVIEPDFRETNLEEEEPKSLASRRESKKPEALGASSNVVTDITIILRVKAKGLKTNVFEKAQESPNFEKPRIIVKFVRVTKQ